MNPTAAASTVPGTPAHPVLRLVGLIAGPALMALALLLPLPGEMPPEGRRTAAITLLMATWWITEAIPLAATALLPIALFPLLAILPAGETTAAYGDPNIFLFAGGFFIAMAMQKWRLHERIALSIILRAGTAPARLVLGFMIATAALSLWISNTATTVMMLPIAIGVIEQIERQRGASPFAPCLLLGLAYAASIGGIGTLIGTPPNLVLAAQFTRLYPEAPPIGFLQWMLFGIPLVLIFLPLTWLLLTRVLFRFPRADARDADARDADARAPIRDRLIALGPISRGERTVAIVAALTALAWIFRADINLGSVSIPGWSGLFPRPAMIHHATIAIFFAALLFIIPVDLRRRQFALDWEWARRIPWDVLILFGGGLALARAFESSGLVLWLGGRLGGLGTLPPILIVMAVCTLLTFTTELTSNVATATIMLPILGGAAPALGLHPLILMIPAGVSASCAFMLPVATPPNAIVFGGGRLTVAQMARAGLAVNILGIFLVTALMWLIGFSIFDINPGAPPPWSH